MPRLLEVRVELPRPSRRFLVWLVLLGLSVAVGLIVRGETAVTGVEPIRDLHWHPRVRVEAIVIYDVLPIHEVFVASHI